MIGWNIIHFLRYGTLDYCYIRIIRQQDMSSPLLNHLLTIYELDANQCGCEPYHKYINYQMFSSTFIFEIKI